MNQGRRTSQAHWKGGTQISDDRRHQHIYCVGHLPRECLVRCFHPIPCPPHLRSTATRFPPHHTSHTRNIKEQPSTSPVPPPRFPAPSPPRPTSPPSILICRTLRLHTGWRPPPTPSPTPPPSNAPPSQSASAARGRRRYIHRRHRQHSPH